MVRVGVCSMLVLVLAGAAVAAVPPGYTPGSSIDMITISNVPFDFAPAAPPPDLGTLTLDGPTAQATIAFQDVGANPFGFTVDFDMETFLKYDWSSGGQLEGRFEGGQFSLYSGSDLMLGGNVVFYVLGEDPLYPGALVAYGKLESADGGLIDIGDWVGGDGSANSIKFNLDTNPNDFSAPFSGSAFLNIAPDARFLPEPATILLLTGGLLALRRRVR